MSLIRSAEQDHDDDDDDDCDDGEEIFALQVHLALMAPRNEPGMR